MVEGVDGAGGEWVVAPEVENQRGDDDATADDYCSSPSAANRLRVRSMSSRIRSVVVSDTALAIAVAIASLPNVPSQ